MTLLALHPCPPSLWRPWACLFLWSFLEGRLCLCLTEHNIVNLILAGGAAGGGGREGGRGPRGSQAGRNTFSLIHATRCHEMGFVKTLLSFSKKRRTEKKE